MAELIDGKTKEELAIEGQKIYESITKKESYLGKSSIVGWNKFRDILAIADISEKGAISDLVSGEDTNIEEYQRKMDIAKERVIDAKQDRDTFAINNPDDIGLGTKLMGGMIESITNPIELATNVGVGVATGGASLAVRLAAQATTDVAQVASETSRYEDRLPTMQETAFTLGASILPDVLIAGAPKIRKHFNPDSKIKDTISDIAHNVETGNETIKSPLKTITEIDNIGRGNKASQQAIQTEYGVSPNKVDNYNTSSVETTNFIDRNTPISNYAKEVDKIYKGAFAETVEQPKMSADEFNIKTNRLASIIEEQKTTTNKDELSKLINEQKGLESQLALIDKGIKPEEVISVNRIVNLAMIQDKVESEYGKGTTLGRYMNQSKYIENYETRTKELLKDKKYLKSLSQDKKSEIYQFEKTTKKTPMQKLIKIQNKYNNKPEELAQSIAPTIKEHYARWKNVNSKITNKKPKKVALNYEQIRTGINNMDAKLETQKSAIVSEYQQKLGKEFPQFIKDVGSEGKEMSTAWIKGNSSEDFAKFAKDNDCEDFLNSAYDDSVRLDSLSMKANIFDNEKYNIFIKKYGSSFDEDGDLIYDGNIFKNLSKANREDIELLQNSFANSNPKEYVNFISNAKQILDRKINKLSAEEYNELISSFNINEKSLKRYLNKFKDDINTRYNDITLNKTSMDDNQSWKKNAIYAIENKQHKLSQESIKINQTVNKQTLLKDLELQYFTKDSKLDLINDGYKKATIIQDSFDKDIKPYYDEGILVNNGEISNIEHFAKFIASLKKTRASAKWTGDQISIGDLRHFFGENKMSDFFLQIGEGKYLKKNWEMISDIADYNTSKSARFMEYGSVSPFAMKNKFHYKLNDEVTKVIGKELSSDEKNVVNSALKQLDTYMENTHLKFNQGEPTNLQLVERRLRHRLSVGIIGLTGINEVVLSNQAIAAMRGQKFGGIGVYNVLRKTSGSNLFFGKSKYIQAQVNANLDFGKFATEGIVDNIDRAVLGLQRYSDTQIRKIGEAHAVSIFDNLPKKYESLQNEIKDVLRMNNIDEANYTKFKNFSENHIKNNNLIVNTNGLVRSIEEGKDMEMSNALKNSYYQVSQYIGDLRYQDKFLPQTQGEIQKWYTMFRGFTRALNKDMFGRLLNYTDIDGVSKARLSKQYIQNRNIIGANSIGGDMAALGVGLGAIVLGNQSSDAIKEMTISNRTLDQRLAVTEVKLEQMQNLFKDKDFFESTYAIMDKAGVTPENILQATDLPISMLNKVYKIYDTFTDEEKKAFGTNRTEGGKELAIFVSTYFGSRVFTNEILAINKYITKGDVLSTPTKMYGMSKEDMAKVYTKVLNSGNIGDVFNKDAISNERKVIKAESNFLNNSNESYDNLPTTKYKTVLEERIANFNDSDKNEAKQHFAICYSDNALSEENKASMLAEHTEGKIQLGDVIDKEEIVSEITSTKNNTKEEYRLPTKDDLDISRFFK